MSDAYLDEARKLAQSIIETTGDGVPDKNERLLERLRLRRKKTSYALARRHLVVNHIDGTSLYAFVPDITDHPGSSITTEIFGPEDVQSLKLSPEILGLQGMLEWPGDAYDAARRIARIARLVRFGEILPTSSRDQLISTTINYATKTVIELHSFGRGVLAASGYGGASQGIVITLPTPNTPMRMELRDINSPIPEALISVFKKTLPYGINIESPDPAGLIHLTPARILISLNDSDALTMMRTITDVEKRYGDLTRFMIAPTP